MNTTTNGVTTGRKNAITGIEVGKVVREKVMAALVRNGKSPDDASPTEQLALELFVCFEPLPIERKIRCDNCGGIGDDHDDKCPYCGHDEGTPLKAEVPPAKVAPPSTTVPDPKTTKKTKTKPEAIMQTTTNGSPHKGLAKTTKKDDTKLSKDIRTERDLDTAMREVERLKGQSSVEMWRLGAKIAEIHKGGLWKLRTETDKDGKSKPRWSSFEAFCIAEIGMTPKNARILMDVSGNYSEPQVIAFGTHKLGLILQAPEKDRPALEKQAAGGASKREIAAAVKKAKKGKAKAQTRANTSASRDTTAASAAGAKAKAAQAKAKVITVANILGVQQVKLYKRPASIKGDLDFKTMARAKKIGDQPFGKLELTNEVSMYFTVYESPGGELILKIVTDREQ